MYCIDIQCVSNNLVQIRDGVYSVFETNKVIDSLSPIQNLQVSYKGISWSFVSRVCM
jgi:hypothetical protein